MRIQGMLRTIADLAAKGQLPKVLQGITTQTHIKYLMWYQNYPRFRRRDLEDIAKAIQGKRGSKRLIQNFPAVMRYAGRNSDWVDVPPQKVPFIDQAIKLAKSSTRSWTYNNWVDNLRDIKRMHKIGIFNPSDYTKAREALLALEVAQEQSPEEKKRTPGERVDTINLIGRKIPGYSNIKPLVIQELIDKADLRPGLKILEPSAGAGDIADAIRQATPDAQDRCH